MFRESLRSGRKVDFLRSHSFSHSYGSTTTGELHLAETKIGLALKFYPKDDAASRELVEEARAGKLRLSVGFRVVEQQERMLDGLSFTVYTRGELEEVSAVPDPAVEATALTVVPAATCPPLALLAESDRFASTIALARVQSTVHRIKSLLGREARP